MDLINWSEKYSVKIEQIDLQHQKMVEIINDLHDAMKHGKSKEILSELIERLVSYTNIHFATEEQYFQDFGYPDSAAHEKEHMEFVEELVKFKDKYNDGQLTLSIEIMQFLKEWLLKHILGTDKKYISLFHEHGLR